MLPHYSPYKVAENFLTLEALHPNRIDLGIGNSSGGRMINRVLNEEKSERLTYKQQVKDIVRYIAGERSENHRFPTLTATPISETMPEVWMLGGGGESTNIAAFNGTAFTFAHFIKPDGRGSVERYREHFQPSIFHSNPFVSIAVFVIVAETASEAEQLARAFDLWMVSLETAKNPRYFPSIDTANHHSFTPFEKQKIHQIRKRAIIGNPKQVREEIIRLAEMYHADEVTIIPNFPGIEKRMAGIRMLAEIIKQYA
ncbi:MsnO8 family LLM class oxidoreductase [Oceanobacillus zhaokaii]|uniref:MsnO8 family LLM class oxidoreductase n=1 Tax=Oceanobacillus zhaokaii TaxID=2052660 RepID=UPI00268EFBCB